jgi:hypothetical protein
MMPLHAPTPPEIPQPRSAAISPVWENGRLTIASAPAPSDLPADSLMAALAAARTKLERVLTELAAAPGNIDKRLIAFAARVAASVPTSPPDQFAVFVFGQEADALKLRIDLAVGEGELSADDAAELQSAADQLSDCALQFPAWREFKRNARAAVLTSEQITAAPELAFALADQMETQGAREFVDESVPQALRILARSDLGPTRDDPTGAIKAGTDLLALDLIESVGNVFKRLSSGALRGLNAFTSGAGEGVLDELHGDGKRFGRGLVRLTLSLITGGALTGLVLFTPAFPWLADVAKFLTYAKQFFPR